MYRKRGAAITEHIQMGLRLIKLTEEYREELCAMIDEWRKDQEMNHTNHSPWAIFKNDCADFDYYLSHLDIAEPEGGLMPESAFFLLDEERNRLLGAVGIRHCLSEYLLREGGHIGAGIRPSGRRKGYGTKLILLSLEECAKLGIDRVLLVCDKDNTGSARAIEKAGGVLENEIIGEEGKPVQRWWITLH